MNAKQRRAALAYVEWSRRGWIKGKPMPHREPWLCDWFYDGTAGRTLESLVYDNSNGPIKERTSSPVVGALGDWAGEHEGR